MVNSYYPAANLVSNPDFLAATWTNSGTVGITREFFRFWGLSAIPAGTTIISATLTLSGLSSGVAIPQGNSYYPGSPYNSYGSNPGWIKRVTGSWNESTITWINQSSTTSSNAAYVPHSTSQWNFGVSVDITALIQDLVNSGQNNGLSFQMQTEVQYRALMFPGRRHPDAAKWPRLVITYVV